MFTKKTQRRIKIINKELNTDIELYLSSAINLAVANGHEYLTAEHILFSLLQADKVQDVFEEIGGRNECLQNDLLLYFKNDFLQHKEKR